MISREELIEAIEKATRTIRVCVPWYGDDWSEDTISYVDPHALIAALEEKK